MPELIQITIEMSSIGYNDEYVIFVVHSNDKYATCVAPNNDQYAPTVIPNDDKQTTVTTAVLPDDNKVLQHFGGALYRSQQGAIVPDPLICQTTYGTQQD